MYIQNLTIKKISKSETESEAETTETNETYPKLEFFSMADSDTETEFSNLGLKYTYLGQVVLNIVFISRNY